MKRVLKKTIQIDRKYFYYSFEILPIENYQTFIIVVKLIYFRDYLIKGRAKGFSTRIIKDFEIFFFYS